MKKRISLLGSTGSIGTTSLEVAKHLDYAVVAMATYANIDLLEQQIAEYHPEIVAVYDVTKAKELRQRCPNITVLEGESGVCEVAAYPLADFTLVAIVGMAALAPTLAAIEAGKTIGLANKEVLVSAGEFVTKLAKEKGVTLLPIDSEHSAIFQCLEKMGKDEVYRIILTASGGPFRTYTKDQLEAVTLKDALNHPTWTMGPKITVDSSTLMNKGLEMIEAYWLFGRIPDVLIHPQSMIHSMVEAIDGTVFAQLHENNMSYPIQYALTYPKRAPGRFPPFNFIKHSTLEFYLPDTKKFPTLKFAAEALHVGKSLACYLNAANEILVERFLQEKISWLQIASKLETLIQRHQPIEIEAMETVLAVDAMAREEAKTI